MPREADQHFPYMYERKPWDIVLVAADDSYMLKHN
jgi:hypothetical protein